MIDTVNGFEKLPRYDTAIMYKLVFAIVLCINGMSSVN